MLEFAQPNHVYSYVVDCCAAQQLLTLNLVTIFLVLKAILPLPLPSDGPEMYEPNGPETISHFIRISLEVKGFNFDRKLTIITQHHQLTFLTFDETSLVWRFVLHCYKSQVQKLRARFPFLFKLPTMKNKLLHFSVITPTLYFPHFCIYKFGHVQSRFQLHDLILKHSY